MQEPCTCHILSDDSCFVMVRQGVLSPRRALAAANTSPPLPVSPDQAPASLAPALHAHELSPLPDDSGVETALDGARDALGGEKGR